MRLIALILLLGTASAQGITNSPSIARKPRTNYALQSNNLTLSTNAVSPWNKTTPSTIATIDNTPYGVISSIAIGNNAGNFYQLIGTHPSSKNFAVCADVAHPTSSGPFFIGFTCPAGNNCASVKCVSSDGRVGTVYRSGINCNCNFTSSVGWVRACSVGVCTSAATSGIYIQMSPGVLGDTRNDPTLFKSVQFEVNVVTPSKHCITTSSVKTCS